MEKQIIAAFDFDGTITLRNTLPDFIVFSRGYQRFIAGGIRLAGTLLQYLFKQIPAGEAKQRVITYFFKGCPAETFNALCTSYAEKRLPHVIRPSAQATIEQHRKQNHTLVIISGSMENWIAPWALKNGFEQVLATKLEVSDGKLTGRLGSANCSGPEKVRRLLETYPDRHEYELYAYGNGRGDRELLELADHPLYRKWT